ncbi:MAG: GDSL-type esterase/lipase family protein [Lawsonella sp.]
MTSWDMLLRMDNSRWLSAGATFVLSLALVSGGFGIAPNYAQADPDKPAQPAVTEPETITPPVTEPDYSERGTTDSDATTRTDGEGMSNTPKEAEAVDEDLNEGEIFVALGDSTQALSPNKVRIKTENGCIHNDNNWPEEVAKVMQMPLTDLSCAGAKTGRYWKQPLQKLGYKTQLVVVSYGSNDFGTVDQLFKADARSGTQEITQGATREEVEEQLLRVLKDIRKRAPNATIITVGYLPLMKGGNCPNILKNVTLEEQQILERMREETDIALENASKLAGPNVYNVPLRDVVGHDLCHPDHTFIINRGPGVRFHYNNAGIRFIADKVIALYREILQEQSEEVVE